MPFRQSESKPLAYLVSASGAVAECHLMQMSTEHLVAYVPDMEALGEAPRLSIYLSLTKTPTPDAPMVQARIQGKGIGEHEYILSTEQPALFWQAALDKQTYNRRQAFRVQTLDCGSRRSGSKLTLTASIEQGSSVFAGELMNLSIEGCNLKFPSGMDSSLPKSKSRVLIALDGPALPSTLRLPAIIQRRFHHPKNPRIGLRFQATNNPAWLKIERQLQAYLMERQREQIRFRAA